MWILGHTALAYLLIRGPTYRRAWCDPKLVFLIFIFANITDSLHFPYLRNIIHNPAATIGYSLFWIWFLERYHIITTRIAPILLLATLVHIAADLLFSNYLLFVPINRSGYTLLSWNSVEDLISETILSLLAIFVLRNSGDLERLNNFMQIELRKFHDNFNWKEPYNPDLFLPYMIILFALFFIGQFLINIIVNANDLVHGVWYVWTFTILFIIFIAIHDFHGITYRFISRSFIRREI